MTATALPDIDRSTLEDLRKRLPDLSELEPPRMEDVGRRADAAVDRLLGRSRAPMWPRVLAAIGLIALVGLLAAWITWGRRPGWSPAPEEDDDAMGLGGNRETIGGTMGAETVGIGGYDTTTGLVGDATTESSWDRPEGSGLTAAEASLATSREPDERA
jgi:hypothetical protein